MKFTKLTQVQINTIIVSLQDLYLKSKHIGDSALLDMLCKADEMWVLVGKNEKNN